MDRGARKSVVYPNICPHGWFLETDGAYTNVMHERYDAIFLVWPKQPIPATLASFLAEAHRGMHREAYENQEHEALCRALERGEWWISENTTPGYGL